MYDLAISFSVLWKCPYAALTSQEERGTSRETYGDGRLQDSTVPQTASLEANAQALPAEMFPDNIYDLNTIAVGIRFVTSIRDVLREVHRVLKPGGTFACLEFNKVTNPVLAQLYDQYLFLVISLSGTILAGDRASYQYLVESIQRFQCQGDLAQLIADAGFATGGNFEGDGGAWRDLWGGIACIHTGVKI